MRCIFVFLLLGTLHSIANTAYSQTTRLSLSLKDVAIQEVLSKIEKESEFYFTYNTKKINATRKVSIDMEDKTVLEILNQIFTGEDINYTISDRHIILYKTNDPQPEKSGTPFLQQTKKQITGTVTDERGEPIIGANAVEKGTTNGVITDIDGKFSLSVEENAIIEISYIGYITQSIPVRNQTNITVALKEDLQALDEVVVVGYSTLKKRDLTGAVSVVKVTDIENKVSSNVMQTLQGRVPGVFITSNGSPDGAAEVLIRGVSTLGNKSRSGPLYIIDGMPSTSGMNELSSQDIESIQVLKDASSASIYGSRAANGVIIITTKKADRQQTIVTARAALSVRGYSKSLDWLNTEERGRIQWQAHRNDGTNPNFGTYSFRDHQDANGNWILDEVIIPEFIDSEHTMRSADTDWVKEVGQTAVAQNYNVTVSTGGTKGRSLFSLDYLDNRGTVKETYNNRISARINSDYSILDGRLTLAENFSMNKTKRSRLNAGDILTNTRAIQPIVPIHTVDGIGWGGPVGGMGDRQNPLRRIEQSKNNANHIFRLFGDASLNFEIIKNLNLKTMVGIDYTFFWYRNMFLPYQEGYMSDLTPVVTHREERYGNWVWTNTLNYSFELNKNHRFEILAGQEMMCYNQEWIGADRKNYASLNPDYMYLNVGETAQINSGSATEYALLSYFGKINYNYMNKYLVSATLRYDGSSRFGANNRFATFPAFSLGWRASEEDFFKEAFPFLTDFKLRYGWGQTGNQDIADFASLGLYEARYASDWIASSAYSGTAYDITGADTGTLPSGYIRTQQANPNLRWETATQNNMGVDFALVGNKLVGSFDYFIKNTKDILVSPPYIGALGEGGNMYVNGATMKNTGFEFLLSYNDRIGDFRFGVTGNIGAYRSKITHLPPEVWDSYPGNGVDDIILGHSRYSFYGHVTDGLFQTQAEVDAHAAQTGKGIGRIRFKDLNGDGQITLADRTWIGLQDPDFVYGLNANLSYKQMDFSMFWNGVWGGVVDVSGTKQYTDFFGVAFSGENNGKRTLDAWTPLNTGSTIPMLSATNANNEGQSSTYYLESSSYLKLRNIEFGYTLPKSLQTKLKMKNTRLYISGDNLIKIKKTWGDNAFTGVDPETPTTSYPIPYSVTFGINVSF
ncbi:MAG: TonB-dependent receptor [Tannerellaceae bacterium]|nr:TonB-dependent receptor [Tannerellaceae bacterium]